MKKYRGLLFGIGMAILWSVVFVQVLRSPAGIAVGMCFGAALGIAMTASSRAKPAKPEETQGQDGPGKDG